MNIRIYLTNLAAYNRGDLIGEWVTLPVEEEELQDELNKVLAQGEPGDEEYFITDYEPGSLSLSEYFNIFSLNELAMNLEGMDEDVVETLLQDYGLEETIEIINNGDYHVFDDCNDMEDVARVIVEECDYLANLPEELQYYFDYRSYGQDLEINGIFISHPRKSMYVEVFW